MAEAGAIVLAAMLAVFVAVLGLTLTLTFSSSPAYGAPEANPPPTNAATTKPKVEAAVRHGQLNVLGTGKGDNITLRLNRATSPGSRWTSAATGPPSSPSSARPSTGSSYAAHPAPTCSSFSEAGDRRAPGGLAAGL